jgi:phosphonopyruvate decarboxylase
MITSRFFIETLKQNNIEFYTGVPDSLLKNLCAYIADTCDGNHNIIAANEGAAIGLAAGYHLASGKIALVYMQNSGLGNAINPLTSLTDKEVYNIPMLLLIGWRGEPGIQDEPQHKKQGKLTIPLLDTLGIRNAVLSHDESEFKEQLADAVKYMINKNETFAFVVQKDTFSDYAAKNSPVESLTLSREEAIHLVASSLRKNDIAVSTTGMISRELFEYREKMQQGHEKDFLTVGSMGHASQIALGIALQKPHRKVFCFDGDGALIMHMGSIAIAASKHPKNYIHIVFNNGAHDSVGGQPTVGLDIDIPQIAKKCGYTNSWSATSRTDLIAVLQDLHTYDGPILLEIKVKKGNRKNLGRPTITPIQNKLNFMDFLRTP